MDALQPAPALLRLPYSRIWVYHTTHHMYIVGSNRQVSSKYGVLRLTRHDGAWLEATEHSIQYDVQQVNNLLRQLHCVNQMHGGLVFVTKVGHAQGHGT